jgi:hypothetical protein
MAATPEAIHAREVIELGQTTGRLLSMDGYGARRDNAFVERL